MNIAELAEQAVDLAVENGGRTLVMVMVEGGELPPLQVNHLRAEHHEESNQTTIWIEAEEM